MTTTTKGTTMTTPESPAVPVFAPHSPAAGAGVQTEPRNGTGAHTIAAYVVRVTADNVRMDRVRCDGCAWWSPSSGECGEPDIYAGKGYCSIYTPADHACNAWTPITTDPKGTA